jgi:hypothetical protein
VALEQFSFAVDPGSESFRASKSRLKSESVAFLRRLQSSVYNRKKDREPIQQFLKNGEHFESFATWFYLTRVAAGEFRASVAELGREYHVTQNHSNAVRDSCEDHDRKAVEYGIRSAALLLPRVPMMGWMTRNPAEAGKPYGRRYRTDFRPEVRPPVFSPQVFRSAPHALALPSNALALPASD